jgi:acylphosphatase
MMIERAPRPAGRGPLFRMPVESNRFYMDSDPGSHEFDMVGLEATEQEHMTCIEITVRGRVQGVGFRQHTVEHARRLGLTGWVRNEDDGSVLIRACGEEDSLRALARELQAGPAPARVDVFEAKEVDADEPAPESFKIRH